MRTEPRFAVILSDMRMPGMSGVELLTQAKAEQPDTVRMLLTGQGDINTVVTAVNRGGIFRFLCKPCPTEAIIEAIEDGIEQHRLVTSERELLEETLSGVVKMLTDLLAIASPTVFNRATRLRSLVQSLCEVSDKSPDWQYELAAQLSLIGCVALPTALVERVIGNESVTTQDRRLFAKHPEIGQRLVGAIPRLNKVAHIIGCQLSRNLVEINDDAVRTGVELLQTALMIEQRVADGQLVTESVRQFCETIKPENHVTFQKLAFQAQTQDKIQASLPLQELRVGMTLDADVTTPIGDTVLNRGSELTPLHLDRLYNFADSVGIVEPIKVMIREDDK